MSGTWSRLRQVARTMQQPASIGAPVGSLGRRVIAGEFWVEAVEEHDSDGPFVAMVGDTDVQPPEDGAGDLNRRVYRVTIEQPDLSAAELLREFCSDPNRFSPTSYAEFAPDPTHQLTAGDQVTVELPGPWDGPVTVVSRDERSMRLETRRGHMEAGWIEFRTSSTDDLMEFEIESVARSGDLVFDALYHGVGIGKLVQTDMWVSVLEAAVDISGGRQRGRVFVNTIRFLGADS